MTKMKKQKIVAVHMNPTSGGIGPQCVKSVRLGRDRVEIFERDDDRGFVYVSFFPPKSAPLDRAVVLHTKVPLSQVGWMELEERWMELEEPEAEPNS